jgi:predicted lipoprotein with Yx(FWY)xxD motif
MSEAQPPPYTAPNPVEISVFFEGGRYVFRNDDAAIYSFDKDTPGKSNCDSTCTRIWPPVAAPDTATTVGDWTAILRDNKTRQWAYKGKPVYTYGYDQPGKAKGDGIDGLWHVVNP